MDSLANLYIEDAKRAPDAMQYCNLSNNTMFAHVTLLMSSTPDHAACSTPNTISSIVPNESTGTCPGSMAVPSTLGKYALCHISPPR
jgi:hypothetical protein